MKKKIFQNGLILLLMFTICGCGKIQQTMDSTSTTKSDMIVEDSNKDDIAMEDKNMRLFINDDEVPVTWEKNESVNELMNETAKGDIVINMSMYSDNEQVGSLGRSYTSSNKQITTHNGDIVLYNSSNIVVFYGSNSWSYTRLGKMDLSEKEVTALLSNGDVQLKITR
ncbi:MAG: cyclophilin-like fold protein [Eubacteriales bacterium]|nr:cyclophilin-like fold protein [Eubacteriales bacterium]